jgi:hypothetical protein
MGRENTGCVVLHAYVEHFVVDRDPYDGLAETAHDRRVGCRTSGAQFLERELQ